VLEFHWSFVSSGLDSVVPVFRPPEAVALAAATPREGERAGEFSTPFVNLKKTKDNNYDLACPTSGD